MEFDIRKTPARQVRVTAPTKVLYDFDAFVDLQRSLFDRLGHPACTSGFDIFWQIEQDFLFDGNELIGR